MVEIYVSWCKGLVLDDFALNILKSNKLVDGVETRDYLELPSLHKSGLRVSIHNPIKELKCEAGSVSYLESPYLMNVLENNPYLIENWVKTDTPTLGFHAGHSAYEEQFLSFSRLIDNANYLCDKIKDKNVIFETHNFPYNFFGKSNQEYTLHSTGPEFVNELTTNTDLGFLLDVAHVFISGNTRILNGLYNGSIEDYFGEIVESTNERVYQLHVNVPCFEECKGYFDIHRPFDDSELAHKIIDLTKYVVQNSPELKVITLEMDTGLSPLKHVKKLCKQTEYLNSFLNVK